MNCAKSLVVAMALLAAPFLSAGVILNPSATVDSFFSLGEFGSSTDGWTGANFTGFAIGIMTAAPQERVLRGDVADTANDPQFKLQGIQSGPSLGAGQYDILEFRIGRLRVDSRIDVFWGTTIAGGFSGTRRVDDQGLAGTGFIAGTTNAVLFDVVQIDMSSVGGWDGVLTDLRIDPFVDLADTSNERLGREAFLDYVRVGSISDVPAPATLALFGLGLAGLGFSRRKKA